MNEPNRVPAGCPSEFALERLRLAELADPEAGPVMNHVEGCSACARRIEELSAVPPAFDLDAVWRAARSGPAEVPLAPRRWLRGLRDRWTLGLTAAATVAAAAVVVVALRPALPPTDVRKGPPWTFAVLVKRRGEDKVTRPLSGARLSAGDRLRFEVTTKSGVGYVAVVGADSRGVVTPLAPASGGAAQVRGGRPVVLDGAVELDDAPGAERIDLVGCPRPYVVADLVRAVRQAVERGVDKLAGIDGVAPGCYQESFWIEKVAR